MILSILPILLLYFSTFLVKVQSGTDKSFKEQNHSLENFNEDLHQSKINDHGKPFHVELFFSENRYCEGSLISKNYVLTAAKCLENKTTVKIAFGLHGNDNNSKRLTLISEDLRPHPEYDPINFKNDIGLIKLPKPIDLNEKIQTIQLATKSDFTGQKASVTGWAVTTYYYPRVEEIEYKVLPNSYCASSGFEFPIQSSMICAASFSKCNGHAGSPLVFHENEQIGLITYYRWLLCGNGAPAVFTRIANYTKWISDNSDWTM